MNKKKLGLFLSILLLMCAVAYLMFKNFKNFRNEKDNKYNDNEVVYVKITDEDIAELYFYDFIETIQINRENAYKLLDDDYKKNISFSEFEEMLNNIEESNGFDIKLKSYSVKKSDNYKLFYIKDENDNIYIFKEKSIMNYTVYLDEEALEM